MRILQMVDYYGNFGGLERFIYNFSLELLEQGHDTVITALEAEETDWGTDVVPTIQVGALENWEARIAEYQPDLIIWHQGIYSGDVVYRLTKTYPVLATVHAPVCPARGRLFRDKDEICCKPGGLGCLPRWYMRKCGSSANPKAALQGLVQYNSAIKALKACRRIYTVSKSLKDFLVIDGIPENNVIIFDNTLGELAHFYPELAHVAPDAQELKLLYIGRLVYSKGVQYFLRSIRLLRERGIEATGTVVGDGWYGSKLKNMAEELGIADAVRFVGKVAGKEVHQWYERSDVAVVPSIWPEPAGLVVPEARALGKPVVVFDAGGLPEWSQWMDGIYVSRHADAEDLADTVETAWNDLRQGKPAGLSRTAPVQPEEAPEYRRINIIEDLHSVSFS
ncbi:MAG: glycosyltransferase [Paenibacillaceae bacterium]|jgi:glycosyltransferase involved in cell wall biosynthesis|nr:glycosyltransferase [Paenibacillaceae bacterium]